MKLSDSIKEKILEHAKEEYPRECCGLVAVVKGRERYFPRNNIASTPSEHFVLDGYEEIEDKGEIISIIHSHPKTTPTPSEADRVACEKSELPWHIVNPQTGEWGYCEPNGYELPYVGREFVHGVVDCYTLWKDWYKRELGVEMTEYNRRDEWWLKGEDLYRDNFANEGMRKIRTEDVEYGDIILMQLEAPVPNHAAIYIGDQMVLHHVQGRLSSRDIYGGYYLKSTAMVLRHKSR